MQSKINRKTNNQEKQFEDEDKTQGKETGVKRIEGKRRKENTSKKQSTMKTKKNIRRKQMKRVK